MLERLSAEEIRSRYEREMLGQAIGDWMGTLSDGVAQEYAALNAALSSVRERTKDVEAIDPQYTLERSGRARALASEWSAAFDGHFSKLEASLFQLEEAGSFPLSGAEKQILSRVCSDWRELLNQAKKENASTAAALLRLVNLIGAEGGDASQDVRPPS